MSLITATLSRLGDTAPRPPVARPFTALSRHRSIKTHERIAMVLGIGTHGGDRGARRRSPLHIVRAGRVFARRPLAAANPDVGHLRSTRT
jgi:hypothetical protein